MIVSPAAAAKMILRALFLTVCSFNLWAEAASKPNILFILSDNQAASLLGAYGNPDIKTPNIDTLAREGMTFTRAYAVNGLCSPTRSTLMTGLMPSQHGVHSWINDAMLRDWPRDWVAIQEFRTLPLTLKNRGYRTAMIGKWHLGQPWKPALGYEHWATFPLGHSVDFWDNTIITNDRTYEVKGEHVVDHFTDLAVDYINQQKQGEPFYLQLNYNGPYMNPPTNMGAARNRHYQGYLGNEFKSFPRTPLNRKVLDQVAQLDLEGDVGVSGKPTNQASSAKNGYINRMSYLIASMHNDPETMANAASQNTMVDDGVGRVMAALKAKGLDNNTLVIYSSDQGNFYGQHGLWTHTVVTLPSSTYESVLKVPLIMRHPGSIKAGQSENRLVGQYDIMPTILDYAGYSDVEIANSPGQSFAGVLKGENAEERRAVFFEEPDTRGIRTERYVYWKRLEGVGESALFDMEKDPQQNTNLLGRSEYREVAEALDAQLTAFFKRYSDLEYDLWQGGTVKGSVDRPEIFKRRYGEQWGGNTAFKPPFQENEVAQRHFGQ